MAAPTDAYFEGILSKYGGVYTANPSAPKLNQYAGLTAVEMYQALRKTGDSPTLAAAIVYEAWLGEGIGRGVVKAVSAGGAAVGDSAKGTATGLTAFAGGPFGSITSFIGLLETPATWLRIAEGAVGILLIATAVSHMSGAGSAIGKAARALPLVT
jgi:hypothetical protein